MSLDWGREVTGDFAVAERREWLVTNGIGGFASGTVAGSLARRYHGLLVAALRPPLGRTLFVANVQEDVDYDGLVRELGANRWADGSVGPRGYEDIERFRLDGTTPVWTYAIADALLEKRVFMEQGANTTYVSYGVIRASRPLRLRVKALVNHRDYHGATHGDGWTMRVEPVPYGLRVVAWDGAPPVLLLCDRATVEPAHTWYRGFALERERERGLPAEEDHLHAGTFVVTVSAGESVTLTLSTESAPSTDGDVAWDRRVTHEAGVLDQWHGAQADGAAAPPWIRQLVLAADQFIVQRGRTPARGPVDDGGGLTVIAGYHWFGDWGRDTMIALPGLTLTTGRHEIAARILRTFAAYVNRGMLPNRFPDQDEAPEYNTVDATLWYFEALRAYLAATDDDALVKELVPVLESIIQWHQTGTRYGIGVDPVDGLLRAGEPGVQLTWMDAKIGDWVVTPRTGKPVEINALWYNALVTMAEFARRLGRAHEPWAELAAGVRSAFGRFWNHRTGYCHDVIDGPAGDDPTLRPNQIFAVALSASPLDSGQQRAVVDACGRELLTSYGLRTLPCDHPDYRGTYRGSPTERDAVYHQGPAWAWLLGPFAIAHHRVYGDAEVARTFLEPLAHHLADYGVGSIAEIFEGDAPFRPCGCIAQAWSVAETIRAWHELGAPR